MQSDFDYYGEKQSKQDFHETAFRKGFIPRDEYDRVIEHFKQETIATWDLICELRSRIGLYENILKKIKNQNEELSKTLNLFIQG